MCVGLGLIVGWTGGYQTRDSVRAWERARHHIHIARAATRAASGAILLVALVAVGAVAAFVVGAAGR